MNKTAQEQLFNHYYALGAQYALSNAGMSKTAGLGSFAARTGGGVLGAMALSAPGMRAGGGLGRMISIRPYLDQIASAQKKGIEELEWLTKVNPDAGKAVLKSVADGSNIGLMAALGIGGIGGQHLVKRLLR